MREHTQNRVWFKLRNAENFRTFPQYFTSFFCQQKWQHMNEMKKYEKLWNLFRSQKQQISLAYKAFVTYVLYTFMSLQNHFHFIVWNLFHVYISCFLFIFIFFFGCYELCRVIGDWGLFDIWEWKTGNEYSKFIK